MKILVIGGSYFYGRVFVMQAAREHEVTVVNRGTYSMAALGVREVRGDRKDEKLWQSLEEDYDVMVDFCAYEQGDIARALGNMRGKVRQYIFISTVDVYERGIKGINGADEIAGDEVAGNGIDENRVDENRIVGIDRTVPAEASEAGMYGKEAYTGRQRIKDEETSFETRIFPGEAGQYIAGKVALEKEIREECTVRGIHYTVLRPAILYGPYNYAPRESAFIQIMVQNQVLPHIQGASGKFQMIYVKDAAEAILKCLMNENAYGQAYNLCQDEIVTYDSFYEALKKAAGAGRDEIPELSVTAGEAEGMGIPLPFPTAEEESEICSNEKSRRELGMEYLDFSEGMARTYRAFQGVFGQVPG